MNLDSVDRAFMTPAACGTIEKRQRPYCHWLLAGRMIKFNIENAHFK